MKNPPDGQRYPPATLLSCQIPWDDQEQFHEDLFRKQVRHLLRLGFDHLYIFGTAGEGYAIDSARYRQVVDVFYEETCGAVNPQVGIIALSSQIARERITYAFDRGFRFFQISLPCWGELHDCEVLRFFRDVCGEFPDAKFLHYNLGRAKRILNAEDYRILVKEIPNLVATKNTGVSIAETFALVKTTPELQHFFGESTYPYGCLIGNCSLLSSFGAVLPAQTHQLFQYGQSKQVELLFKHQTDYLEVFTAVLAPTGGARLMDGAYDKLLVRLSGLEFPMRLLSPYETFSEEIYDQCRLALQTQMAGKQWSQQL